MENYANIRVDSNTIMQVDCNNADYKFTYTGNTGGKLDNASDGYYKTAISGWNSNITIGPWINPQPNTAPNNPWIYPAPAQQPSQPFPWTITTTSGCYIPTTDLMQEYLDSIPEEELLNVAIKRYMEKGKRLDLIQKLVEVLKDRD
jgi:hypothetical protein